MKSDALAGLSVVLSKAHRTGYIGWKSCGHAGWHMRRMWLVVMLDQPAHEVIPCEAHCVLFLRPRLEEEAPIPQAAEKLLPKLENTRVR